MLQRLPIALAQIKVGNDSEILLNSIRQFVYSLYQSKEIMNKYKEHNQINTIIKMDTMFMNSKKRKTACFNT